MSCNHTVVDGRTAFKLLELFLDYLREALDTDDSITDKIIWGDEVARLQQPASFIPSFTASGVPPSIPDDLCPPTADAIEPPPVSLQLIQYGHWTNNHLTRLNMTLSRSGNFRCPIQGLQRMCIALSSSLRKNRQRSTRQQKRMGEQSLSSFLRCK